MELFHVWEGPRIERSKRHQLLDSITISICAVICGSNSWVYVEKYGKSKGEWFHTFLDLPRGIPSHDTLRQVQDDVFSRPDPDQFQRYFMEWTQAMADLLPGEVVAIDGTTVRRSHDNRLRRDCPVNRFSHRQLSNEKWYTCYGMQILGRKPFGGCIRCETGSDYSDYRSRQRLWMNGQRATAPRQGLGCR